MTAGLFPKCVQSPQRRVTALFTVGEAPLSMTQGCPVIPKDLLLEYLDHFKKCGLVEGSEATGFLFAPDSEQARVDINDLVLAYNERPVTLIRTIYSQDVSKIQSFADAFQIRNRRKS